MKHLDSVFFLSFQLIGHIAPACSSNKGTTKEVGGHECHGYELFQADKLREESLSPVVLQVPEHLS